VYIPAIPNSEGKHCLYGNENCKFMIYGITSNFCTSNFKGWKKSRDAYRI